MYWRFVGQAPWEFTSLLWKSILKMNKELFLSHFSARRNGKMLKLACKYIPGVTANSKISSMV
jgi:hypothetical protein